MTLVLCYLTEYTVVLNLPHLTQYNRLSRTTSPSADARIVFVCFLLCLWSLLCCLAWRSKLISNWRSTTIAGACQWLAQWLFVGTARIQSLKCSRACNWPKGRWCSFCMRTYGSCPGGCRVQYCSGYQEQRHVLYCFLVHLIQLCNS